MSAEIHRLTETGPVLEPPADIIEKLEMLLTRARAGELKYFAFACIAANGDTGNGWAKGCGNAHEVVATVARLYHRVMTEDAEGG